MDVSATSGTSEQLKRSSASLTENFETFLTLLTTQLQNQDPLSPLDTNEFTAQLVQFSSVEQAIQSNQNLENLVDLTKAASSGAAVSYLGTQVTLLGDTTRLTNGEAKWDYTLGANAAETELQIKDSTGATVFKTPGEIVGGEHSFVWGGKNTAGETLPDGNYTLNIVSVDGDEESVPSVTSISGTVSTIDMTGANPLVEVAGVQYLLSDILRIEEPAP